MIRVEITLSSTGVSNVLALAAHVASVLGPELADAHVQRVEVEEYPDD